MKTRILHIILFFISIAGFGQQYSLWVSGENGFTNDLDFSACRTRQVFTIKYTDFTLNNGLLSTGIYDVPAGRTSLSGELRVGTTGCGAPCSDSENFTLNRLQTQFIGVQGDGSILPRCYTIDKTNVYSTARKLEQSAVVLPKYVQPIGLNRERVLTDNLFKSTANIFGGASATIPNVKWQYQTNTNTFFWKDFPDSYKNKFPINPTIEDILQNETNTSAITQLRVKIVFTPPGFTTPGFPFPTTSRTPIVESQVFLFDIFNPSPEFDSIDKEDTRCNYTVDGSFTLNVKRDLNTGEELVITLYDNNNDALVGQQFTTSLTNNGDGTFGYKWTGSLDGGNYKVKFQSHGGTGGINPNDNSWNLLNFSNPFEVRKPARVMFIIDGKSDENCFNVNDGYVEVSASRDGTRGLFYQLSDNGVIQVFNGTNWVNYTGSDPENETFYSFTNGDKTIISKLGKGIYRIKVRDSQKCYMRN
ncbi:hypothetical protein [Tenacibaculum sp. 190524A05c]|uniref:hypothetical protein n=1 Tax=Tenacibaculum platacis TaxID=3137852 RepID=UPI0032B2D8A0